MEIDFGNKDKQKLVNVTVLSLTGHVCELSMRCSDTIGVVKLGIAALAEVPVEIQQLAVGDRILEDHLVLQNLTNSNSFVVTLVKVRRAHPDWLVDGGTAMGQHSGTYGKQSPKSGGGVRCVCVFPDGERLAVCGDTGVLEVWNLSKRTQEFMILLEQWLWCICVTPDCCTMITGSKGGAVKLWRAPAWECERTICTLHDSDVIALCMSPDGSRCMSASWDMTACIWQVESGRMMHRLAGHANKLVAICMTGDGAMVVTASDDIFIKVWNAASGTLLRTLQTPNAAYRVRCMAALPHPSRIVAGCNHGILRVWDVASGVLLQTLEDPVPYRGRAALIGPINWCMSVASLQDGRIAMTRYAAKGTNADNSVQVFDVESGTLQHRWQGHAGRVTCCSITLDGRFVVSGSFDGSVRLWSLDATPCKDAVQPRREHLDDVASLKEEISGETTNTTAISAANSPSTNSSIDPIVPLVRVQTAPHSLPLGASTDLIGISKAQGADTPTDGFYLEPIYQTKIAGNASLSGATAPAIESTTHTKTLCNRTLNGVLVPSVESAPTKTVGNVSLNGYPVPSIESTTHTKTTRDVTLNDVQAPPKEFISQTKTADKASLNGVPVAVGLGIVSRAERRPCEQISGSTPLPQNTFATKVSTTLAVVTSGDVSGVPFPSQAPKSLTRKQTTPTSMPYGSPADLTGSSKAQGVDTPTDGFELGPHVQTKTAGNASLNGTTAPSIVSTTRTKTAYNVTSNGTPVHSLQSTTQTKQAGNATLNGVPVPSRITTRPAHLNTVARAEQRSSD